MFGKIYLPVFHLLCLLWNARLCFTLTRSENASHVVSVDEMCTKQINVRQSESNVAYTQDVILEYSSSIQDGLHLDDMKSVCESLHDVTNVYIAAELLNMEFKCEAAISSPKNSVTFTLTVSVYIDNTYTMKCLLLKYQITLNTLMQERMYIPRRSDDYTLMMQAGHSIIIQENDTTTTAPSMAPTKATADEGPFNTRTLMTLGVFFFATIFIIYLIYVITMRRSMNKIVVGIG